MAETTTLKDWLPVITALVVAIPAFLAWLQSRKNAAKIEVVRNDVNGKMQELVDMSHKAAKSEGKEEERVEERERQAGK